MTPPGAGTPVLPPGAAELTDERLWSGLYAMALSDSTHRNKIMLLSPTWLHAWASEKPPTGGQK